MYDTNTSKFNPHRRELLSLRRQLNQGGIICFLLLMAVLAIALHSMSVMEMGGPYLAAGGVACFAYRYVRGHLHENRGPDTKVLRPSLGVATAITGVRGAAIAFLAALYFTPLSLNTWLAAGVYAFVVLCDFLDGFVARSIRHETILGSKFDVQMDALGLLVASLLAIKLGRLPSWYLLFSGAYYVYQLFIWLRQHWLNRTVYMERVLPSPRTRLYAGFQMVLVVVCLMPTSQMWALTIIATMFMIPSLFTFVRDYMIICGNLHPTSARYLRVEKMVAQRLFETCPIFIRCMITVFVAIGLLWSTSESLLYRVYSGEFGSSFALIYLAVFSIATVLIFCGRFCRLAAALSSVGILGAPVNFHTPAIADEILVFAYSYIMLFGSGKSKNRLDESIWLMKRYSLPLKFRSSSNR